MDKLKENNKIHILEGLLLEIIERCPEFKEEYTTGWDLVEGGKEWLEELKSKK